MWRVGVLRGLEKKCCPTRYDVTRRAFFPSLGRRFPQRHPELPLQHFQRRDMFIASATIWRSFLQQEESRRGWVGIDRRMKADLL